MTTPTATAAETTIHFTRRACAALHARAVHVPRLG